MYCRPFSCTMEVRICKANQALANEAIVDILVRKKTTFELPDHAVNRMLVCSKCEDSTVDPKKAKEAFREGLSELADRITKYDDWSRSPEFEALSERVIDRRKNRASEEKNQRRISKIQKIKEAMI